MKLTIAYKDRKLKTIYTEPLLTEFTVRIPLEDVIEPPQILSKAEVICGIKIIIFYSFPFYLIGLFGLAAEEQEIEWGSSKIAKSI